MINLPIGVDINNLIEDLRTFSWEACEILLFYAQKIKDSKNKSEIIKNTDNDNPVTEADLKVNEFIINQIQENYKDVDWGILVVGDLLVVVGDLGICVLSLQDT